MGTRGEARAGDSDVVVSNRAGSQERGLPTDRSKGEKAVPAREESEEGRRVSRDERSRPRQGPTGSLTLNPMTWPRPQYSCIAPCFLCLTESEGRMAVSAFHR